MTSSWSYISKSTHSSAPSPCELPPTQWPLAACSSSPLMIPTISATVSEGDALRLAQGNAVTLDGREGAKGTVTAVLRSLDPQTRRVPIVAEIPNDPAAPLLAGSFVRATVISPREVDVLALPVSVLRKGSQDEVVVVKDGKAHIAHVTVTPGKEPAQVFVREGLSATDDVLLGATSEVREGEPVDATAAR